MASLCGSAIIGILKAYESPVSIIAVRRNTSIGSWVNPGGVMATQALMGRSIVPSMYMAVLPSGMFGYYLHGTQARSDFAWIADISWISGSEFNQGRVKRFVKEVQRNEQKSPEQIRIGHLMIPVHVRYGR